MPSVVSIETGRGPRSEHQGEYALIERVAAGEPRCTIGVLLREVETGKLHSKLRDHWDDCQDPEEAELLAALDQDFQSKIGEMGGDAFLKWLEDTLSNDLRVSQRTPVVVYDFGRTLEQLYDEHVTEGEVRPFVTHLPLYSLKAAATKFGEERDVEAEGWVKAPANLRLTPEMFVARVVGRSMEPRIPDGSLCVFRAGVVGSRQGRLLLVERFGSTETGSRYTIKKYTSKKTSSSEEGWEHASVRLEPLNKEFEGFELKEGEARVIAEFIQVLE